MSVLGIVVDAINRGNGGEPTLKESFKNDLKPAFVKEFHRGLDAAKNFFKHSGKDADQSIQFAAFESDIVLLDACWSYRRITKERLPLLEVFAMWAAFTWAKEFVSYPGLENAPDVVRWARLSRQEFFGTVLPVAYAATVAPPQT